MVVTSVVCVQGGRFKTWGDQVQVLPLLLFFCHRVLQEQGCSLLLAVVRGLLSGRSILYRGGGGVRATKKFAYLKLPSILWPPLTKFIFPLRKNFLIWWGVVWAKIPGRPE